LKHGVVAGARTAEFASWFHQDFDGNASDPQAKKTDGQ
jgi:hypothetical protein